MSKLIDISKLLPDVKKVKNNFDDEQQQEYNLKIDINFKVYKNQLLALDKNILPEYLKTKLNGIVLKKI